VLGWAILGIFLGKWWKVHADNNKSYCKGYQAVNAKLIFKDI